MGACGSDLRGQSRPLHKTYMTPLERAPDTRTLLVADGVVPDAEVAGEEFAAEGLVPRADHARHRVGCPEGTSGEFCHQVQLPYCAFQGIRHEPEQRLVPGKRQG